MTPPLAPFPSRSEIFDRFFEDATNSTHLESFGKIAPILRASEPALRAVAGEPDTLLNLRLLARPATNRGLAAYFAARLLMLAGVTSPEPLKHGVFRNVRTGQARAWHGGAWHPLVDVFEDHSAEIPRFLRFEQRFFDDLEFAPNFFTPGDIAPDASRLREALAILQAVDAAAFDDFRKRIDVVWLTPAMAGTSRCSFSLRLDYLGGVFVHVGLRSPAAIAEDLMHEYLHQGLWAQWHLSGLSYEDQSARTVQSPFTNNVRPVPTMVQGYLIYLACARLWTHVLESTDARAEALARLGVLNEGIPLLRERLLATCEGPLRTLVLGAEDRREIASVPH